MNVFRKRRLKKQVIPDITVMFELMVKGLARAKGEGIKESDFIPENVYLN